MTTLAKNKTNWYPNIPSLLDSFFEGNLMNWNAANYSSADSTLPSVNVKENNDEYMIEVAAPGMTKEDFKISYNQDVLMISSEKKEENESKEGERMTRKEFSYQSFQRTFTVPEKEINSDEITARYEDGILYLTLPKREEVKPKPARSIEIK